VSQNNVSVLFVTHQIINIKVWNFVSSLRKIVRSTVPSTTKLWVTMHRPALRQLTLPLTSLRLALNNFRNSWGERSVITWLNAVTRGLLRIRADQSKTLTGSHGWRRELSKTSFCQASAWFILAV